MSNAILLMLFLILSSIVMVFFLAAGPRQLRRKLLRILGLVFPLAVFPLWGIAVYRVCLIIPSALFLFLEIARMKRPEGICRFDRFIALIAKEGEEWHISGISTFFWGAFLASMAPGGIGPAVMAMSTLSDLWAAVAGSARGRKRSALGKTWFGSAACLLAALWAGISFAGVFPWSGVSFLQVAVASPVIAAVERVTPGEYDNLAIHVSGATVMVIAGLVILV